MGTLYREFVICPYFQNFGGDILGIIGADPSPLPIRAFLKS